MIKTLKRKFYEIREMKKFRSCLTKGRPYFGYLMASDQGHPKKYKHMQAFLRWECSRSSYEHYQILEIGSWAGGSAVIWAEAIKRFHHGKGFVLCIDPWSKYDIGGEGGVYKVMNQALEKEEIFQLFLHNIKALGHEDIIRWIRMKSEEILPFLRPESFDLIYLDGRHTYEQVLEDLKNAAPLLREGGILCGDDLELQLPLVDVRRAKVNAQVDYIQDPRSGEWFHPGVTLAVAHWFGTVSAWDGFWAMRKQDQNWEPVVIGQVPHAPEEHEVLREN